jgi:hypothetical protein
VRTFVGQDSILVVRRIINDTIGIVSHDRTGASLCHWLAAVPFIAATRLHLALLIPHLQFAPRLLELALRLLAFGICHLPSAIRHLPFVVRHSCFSIPHSEFRIPRRENGAEGKWDITAIARFDWKESREHARKRLMQAA